MAGKSLTSETIFMTEKKMDMALGDIIKMSQTDTIKPNKKQRVPMAGIPITSEAFGMTEKKMNITLDKSFKLRRFMDSRSSLHRQGILAQRWSSFQRNQFPLAVETAANALIWNTTFDQNKRTMNMNKSRERVAAYTSKSPTTNGGNDAYSYTNNSTFQRKILDSIKPLIHEAVAEELDLETLSFPSTIRIVDMGCSVGPNTFFAVQNIIEAVESKFPNNAKIPEIQVFFNDQALNDFNTLFTSLPQNKNYYVAGVPGSFYGRVFPESSLHLVYSACSAIPWLSQVPKQVLENKGLRRTYISNASDEVLSAYSNQCAEDMEKFWKARAQEMVVGGLMFIVFPTRPRENFPHSDFYLNKVYDTLGSCLVDMASKGIIDEEKLNSFHIPLYFASPEQVEESIMRSGYFNIEKRECLPHQKPHDDCAVGSLWMAKIIRAIIETPVKEHFRLESFDEIFDMFRKKLEEGYADIMSGEAIDLLIVLKRK